MPTLSEQMRQSGLQPQKPSLAEQMRQAGIKPKPQEGFTTSAAKGVGKSLLGTVKESSGVGERTLNTILGAALPKSLESKFGINKSTPTLGGLFNAEKSAQQAPTSAQALQSQAELKMGLTPDSLTEAQNKTQQVFKTGTDIAQFFAPQTKLGKAGKALQTVSKSRGAGRLTNFGARIAPQVAGDIGIATAQTGDPVEGLKAGAFSTAFPVAGKVLGKATKPVTSRLSEALETVLPKSLVRTAIGQPKKELLGGRDVSEFVLKKGKIGTAKTLIKQAEKSVDELDKSIKALLKSVPVTKSKITNKNIVQRLVRELNEEGGAISEAEVKKILEQLAPQSKGLLSKPSMGIATANKLRSSIDKTLGDRAFLGSQLPFRKDVLKKFNNILREQVKDKAPTQVRGMFDELSKEITLRDALLNKYGGRSNSVLQLRDMLGAMAGFGTGGLSTAVAGVATNRILQSPGTLIGTARVLKSLPPALREALERLEPAERAILLRLLRGDDS